MTANWIFSVFGVLLLALSGCGPLAKDNRLAGAAASVLPAVLRGDTAEPAVSGPPLNRAFIEAQDGDLLRLSIIDREAVALMVPVAENGSKVTWFSPEGIAFVFDNGLLVGTRGLGHDLMGADIRAAQNALSAGGSHTRILDFLDGLDTIERSTFQCVTTQIRTQRLEVFERFYNTRVLEENCTGEVQFKNMYWIDDAGVIWQSRQWISEQLGYLGYQRL